VPVIQYTDLTEDQKKKYRILDNRLGDLAEYDLDNLKEELKEIDDKWLMDMFKDMDLGLDEEEEWNEETEDDVPEVDEEEETIVKEGDIFELD
jgi:site-specific DNA-methyltransferase (adenine-specific)